MSALDADAGRARFEQSSEAASSGASAAKQTGAAARAPGGLIRRDQPISFTWRGRTLPGYAGDTVSSALLASGVELVGRSFKYHRPRGVTSAGVEEAGALLTIGSGARATPNVNGSTCELIDGLVAEPQNAWPSLEWDMMSLNGVADKALGPIFAAGFYYKTFFSFSPFGSRGTGHWMWFEKVIRRAAGLGALSEQPDPDGYDLTHEHCDVLVVGSGPAGLAAARALAEAGEDVILADQDFELGGRLLSDRGWVEGEVPIAWRDEQVAAARAAGARLLSKTCVFGLYDGGVAGLIERVGSDLARERLRLVRARRVVVAAGAIERGFAFEDNDRPGVMSASALRSYVTRFAVRPGERVAIAATDDSAYEDVDALTAAGAEVVILDARSAEAVPAASGAAQHVGATALRAIGGKRLSAVEMIEPATGSTAKIACDRLALNGGWQPSLHLLAQRGVKLVWDPARGAFMAGTQPGARQPASDPVIEVCGAAAGCVSPSDCAASGRAAAARILGGEADDPLDGGGERAAVYEVRRAEGRKKGKAFVDMQHDVTADDVRLAEREGYISVEHLKRYTTLGMATDQGKTSNVVGLALMAEARGVEIDAVGTTSFRPPYTPVALGALAGDRLGREYRPERRTPMHDWHLARGAVMTDAGLWLRPWYYPNAGEDLEATYLREARTVREKVGMCDVSSLGKILLQGPDAAEFLNRVYVNGFKALPIGRARYGVMLRDDGIAYDDGTVWRLGETDYLITTTTAGAGRVMSWLEKLAQTRWADLQVSLASVTDAWAGFSVAGPLARKALGGVLRDVDLDDAAFPQMGVRAARLGDAPAWAARLSFSGELAYEVMVSAERGVALAEALWDAVSALGGCLYGTEALGALRIEKGHFAGPELDGRTTLADLGLRKMGSTKKPYVGEVLSRRPVLASPDRPTLVGVLPVETGARFSAGAILRGKADRPGPGNGHGAGWVASVTASPALGTWIGLGFIEGGAAAWADETVIAEDPVRGKKTRVKIVSSHMLDAENARLTPNEAAEEAAPEPGAAPERAKTFSALGALIVDGAGVNAKRVDLDGVWAAETPPRRLDRVCAWPGAVDQTADWLGAEFGVSAPGLGRFAADTAVSAEILRLGPAVWLTARALGAPDFALSPDSGAAADVSSVYAAFDFGGARAGRVLARLCALDARGAAFAAGSVAMTEVEHASAIVQRLGPDAYRVYTMRSMALSVWRRLEHVAALASAEQTAAAQKRGA